MSPRTARDVMTDDVSDDVGESLMLRDENFEPPEVPFQPKPTSVSIIAAREEAHSSHTRDSQHDDFSGDSNFTTMPKMDRHEDIHQQNTMILEAGRGRNIPTHKPPPPPPPPHNTPRAQPPAQPIYDDDLHSAPTMIIDIGRIRGRGR